MKKVIISLKIWSALSILFLGWFLMAHVFSEEPMIFNSRRELISFAFFPLGILMGLMVSIRWEMAGGLICFTSAVLSIALIPELIINPYYIFIVLPGVLLMLLGIKKSPL